MFAAVVSRHGRRHVDAVGRVAGAAHLRLEQIHFDGAVALTPALFRAISSQKA
jgi:hypothetical protein